MDLDKKEVAPQEGTKIEKVKETQDANAKESTKKQALEKKVL